MFLVPNPANARLRSIYDRWVKVITPTIINYVNFIPSGSDSLITSDGNTFKVREA